MRTSATRVIDLFRSLDTDEDGSVNAEEFRVRLPSIGFDPGLSQGIDELFKTLDADGSGTIAYSELHKLLRIRDDVAIAPELQEGGAGDIQTESRNAIALRGDAGSGSEPAPAPSTDASSAAYDA